MKMMEVKEVFEDYDYLGCRNKYEEKRAETENGGSKTEVTWWKDDADPANVSG
jgi:hypothetical protein